MGGDDLDTITVEELKDSSGGTIGVQFVQTGESCTGTDRDEVLNSSITKVDEYTLTTKITCDPNKTGALTQSDFTVTVPERWCSFVIEATHASGCPKATDHRYTTNYGGPNGHIIRDNAGFFTQK